MKKRKLIGLASLMLALGVMAGCGDDKPVDPDKHDVPPTECQHEYKFVSVDESKHQEVCEKCGQVKEKSQKNHSFKKDPAKEADNKEANCTDAGWEWQICDKCGATKKKDIAAKGHSFTVVKSTTATCTAAGENTMECSRCGVESPEKQAAEALGHNMVADDSYTEGLAASCTGGGTAREKCTRCTYTEIVPTAPLGHDYNEVAGTEVDGFATLTTGTCKRSACDGKKVYWSALEVTDNCKTNKRLAREAVEADPDNGVEAQEAFYEPNYVEEGDGVRFWGRPIHNACELQENGKPASQSAATPVYDENVTGSFFEYKINLAEAMTDVKLVADMAVTADLGSGELYKATSGDWTPGLHDSTSNKYAVRYAIFVTTGENTVEIALDADGSYTCPGTERQWYTFPSDAFNLAAGEHTIRIAMAGGYLSTYYAFGFEKVVGAIHEHAYTNDPDNLSKAATCTEDGRQYGVCSCGLIEDKVLPKLGHDLQNAESDINVAATCINGGKQHKECSRCDYVEDADIAPLGHDFVADGSPIAEDGFATVNPQKCSRDDVYRYVIAGNDVNEATKTAKVITPADPEAGTEAVTQANYVENNDGSVKFNNIPIHNANGGSSRPTEDTYPSLYSPDEEGSFMAYTFKTGVLEDVKIVMDIKPNQYLGNSRKIFSNDLSSDWTPGLKKIGEGDEATYEAYQERFVFELDGQPLELDLDSDYNEIAGSTRRWFTVPLKNQLDFTAGAHTIKIRMGGGYVCDIYNVGVQTQDTEEVIVPPQPVDEGIKLDVTKATGYTNSADKMKSNAVFTLGEGEGKVNVAPGEYAVKISAKTTNASHSNRKWYNMANPDLQVEGDTDVNTGSNADKTTEDDYRYFMMVDNKVYNPESKDNWGTIGLTNTEFKKVDFVAKIVVLESSKTITIAHGNIGYSLYVEGVTLIRTGDHEHAIEVGAKVGESNMTTFGCACGFGGYEMSAAAAEDMQSGQVVNGSDKNTRLGKGSAKANVWSIAGIEAGTYAVYLKTKTQGGNDTAYFLAQDSIDLGGDSLGNNGNSAEKAAKYRYQVCVDDGEFVNVGKAATQYKDLGITTTEGWSDALCNVEVADGAATITLKNNENGYAIWVYGMRLVKIA